MLKVVLIWKKLIEFFWKKIDQGFPAGNQNVRISMSRWAFISDLCITLNLFQLLNEKKKIILSLSALPTCSCKRNSIYRSVILKAMCTLVYCPYTVHNRSFWTKDPWSVANLSFHRNSQDFLRTIKHLMRMLQPF